MYDTDTQIPWTPPQPPKRKRHVGRIIGVIAGAAVLLVIALVAMAAAVTSSGTSQLSTSTAPTPSASVPAPAPVHKQTLQEWLAGPGGDELKALEDDLLQISKDAADYDMTAIQDDGTMLAADANAARGDLPPAPIKHDYKLAMRDFVRAGHLMEQGDLTDATIQIAHGTEHISAATALVGS